MHATRENELRDERGQEETERKKKEESGNGKEICGFGLLKKNNFLGWLSRERSIFSP